MIHFDITSPYDITFFVFFSQLFYAKAIYLWCPCNVHKVDIDFFFSYQRFLIKSIWIHGDPTAPPGLSQTIHWLRPKRALWSGHGSGSSVHDDWRGQSAMRIHMPIRWHHQRVHLQLYLRKWKRLLNESQHHSLNKSKKDYPGST